MKHPFNQTITNLKWLLNKITSGKTEGNNYFKS